jgi:hypothetical protein
MDSSPDFGRTPSFAQHRSSELRRNSQIRFSACQICSCTSFNTRFLFYMGGINILEKRDVANNSVEINRVVHILNMFDTFNLNYHFLLLSLNQRISWFLTSRLVRELSVHLQQRFVQSERTVTGVRRLSCSQLCYPGKIQKIVSYFRYFDFNFS